MKGHLTFSYRFNGADVISSHGYHQVPTWAPPSQNGYGPYGYMPPPPPPLPGYGYGDEALMKKECSQTVNQNLCLFCLESDPISFQTDRAGFVSITIHCLKSQLDILINDVTNLSMKGVGEGIENVLKDCNVNFSIAELQLNEAKRNLVTLNYEKAFGSVKASVSYLQTCRGNLQKIKFNESPHEVYDDIDIYLNLSSVAKTLIHRLH
ncbi:Invertase/pectin methylesterase inhibitor domain superfamily [Arabidopsis thaliana x Arabidopsis arenosa]|uniref:Invertase/pectin methylesterase inhibitor domain superfamily n=1 Tax=Arabidopsis thaliana x Arabidopsis arenosa TaxID=1240361 RepID=A0A8T1YB19_9BRAS|nr:Invertase/pectin methylesterase inhibitor domain superfamily [Arabidopsis thaliana x Arabidopsis arenosa]